MLAERTTARGETTVRASLSTPRADEVLAAASALRFRRAVDARPVLVGLLGCASVGKSLIFNSLTGHEISRVRYEPHTSQGAVVYIHQQDWDRIVEAETDQPAPFGLFAGAKICHADDMEPIQGVPRHVHIILHRQDDYTGVALVDLPDISSGAAARDPVARRLMPWLDGVLLIVSCDTINGREYDEHVERLDQVGGWRRGVLNNLEGESLDGGGQSLARTRERFDSLDAKPFYILPFLGRQRDFLSADEPGDFTKLRRAMRGEEDPPKMSDTQKLLEFLREIARDVPQAMREREEALAKLEGQVQQEIQRATERLPQLVNPEDVVPPERRADLMKIGYNPYRVVTNIRRLVGGIGRIMPWRRSDETHQMFNERKAVETYARHLTTFESELRKLFDQHPLVRPLISQENPLLPEPVVDDMEYEADIERLIGHLRQEVTKFLDKAAEEFESSGSRTKRTVFYGALYLSTALIVADIVFLPGFGTMLSAGSAAALQALYPELRGHLKAFKPILAQFRNDLQTLCRRHLERIAAAYWENIEQALPVDPDLRQAMEEALA